MSMIKRLIGVNSLNYPVRSCLYSLFSLSRVLILGWNSSAIDIHSSIAEVLGHP